MDCDNVEPMLMLCASANLVLAVGGIVGFALVFGGAGAVQWAKPDPKSFPPYRVGQGGHWLHGLSNPAWHNLQNCLLACGTHRGWQCWLQPCAVMMRQHSPMCTDTACATLHQCMTTG